MTSTTYRGFKITITREHRPEGWRYGYEARPAQGHGTTLLVGRIIHLSKKQAMQYAEDHIVYALGRLYPDDPVARVQGWPPRRSLA